VQKLTNGDVLSDSQWDAFHDLIGQSRSLAWNNATQTAHTMGLPMRADILPPGDGGKTAGKPANAVGIGRGADGHAYYVDANHNTIARVQ
jgi:hypothetical protein